MTPDEFIARWQSAGGSERAAGFLIRCLLSMFAVDVWRYGQPPKEVEIHPEDYSSAYIPSIFLASSATLARRLTGSSTRTCEPWR